MTPRKGLRYAAIRKAQQAKQERDAKRLRRERQVETALAEYFEHTARFEAIEEATTVKVSELVAAANVALERERAGAAVAVQAMLDLGETRTAVTELTGLTLAAVRGLLAVADLPATDTPNDETTVEALAATAYEPQPTLEDTAGRYTNGGLEPDGDGTAYAPYEEPAYPRWADPPQWSAPPQPSNDAWAT
jgi:hypothetical protein